MEKNNIKRIISKVIANTGMKSAKIEAGQACVMFIYQPKAPKQLKHKCLMNTKFQIVEKGVSKTVL